MASVLLLKHPPDTLLASVEDVRNFLRLDHQDDDDEIYQLIQAATAYLDGPHGALHRCILSQVWTETFLDGDRIILSLPDFNLDSIIVSTDEGVIAAGGYKVVNQEIIITSYVPGSHTVEYTVAMPPHLLPCAKVLMKQIISHFYLNRSATSRFKVHTMPYSADVLIAQLRWDSI